MLSSFLVPLFSNKVFLSFEITFFGVPKEFVLNSEISLALSSFSVTENSAPANTEAFIPKISTGVEGNAS